MATAVEIPVLGQVKLSVLANLRHGAPNTQAPVAGKLIADSAVQIAAVAAGEAVQGNPLWYRLQNGAYLWSGAAAATASNSLVPPPAAVPVPVPNLAAGLNQTPLVIDLSHGDGVISFADAKNAGLRGVIHKATTGATGRDDAYAARRTDAEECGLLWGAYHWGTAAPIADQVKNFLEWADPHPNTLVALDFEPTPGNQMTLDGARAFCQQIFDILGRHPVIYSGDTLKSALGSAIDPFFKDCRLWLAQYGDQPTVQRSWATYWLWQYTDGALGPGVKKVPGIPGDAQGRLDCDYFAGTPDDLGKQWAS